MAKKKSLFLACLIIIGVIGFSIPNPAYAGPCDAIVGKWAWFIGGEVTVNPDGTFVQQSGNAGTWECTDAARGRFTFRWRDGGFVNSLAVSPDGQGLTSTDLSQSYVTAQRTGSTPSPRPPLVQKEDCCQEEYACEIKKIEAEFDQKLAQCHHPGNAACNSEAVSTKAEGLKAAGEKLRLCNRTTGNQAPFGGLSTRNVPPPPTSNDEFHSTERTGGACQPCGVAKGADQPAGGQGDVFNSDSPGSGKGQPPSSGPGDIFDSDSLVKDDNTRPGACVKAPYDVRNDVPDADPSLRYTLGFERGFAGCLEEQATIQNFALAALASHFKKIAAALMVLSSPGVIDGVLHPPKTSMNPNPFLRGEEEGKRLCEWGLKVSPVLVARCPSGAGSPRSRICSVKEVMSGYGNAAAAANANGGKRFDCFPCTMAWLKGEPYTPPVDGGTPVPLAEIIALFKSDYGSLVPQGPELPCWRQAAQTKGIPGSMSPAGIVKEMKLAGNGAKGVILTLDPLTGEVGHVFGAKTIGNGRNAKVELWDEQLQMDGDLWFTSGTWEGKWIAFFRVQ